MRLLNSILTLSFVGVALTSPGQKDPDSIELKNFWNDCITPIIKRDKAELDKVVYFPLKGDWGFMMALNKKEEEWTKEDFFNNFDKLFDQEFIDTLKKQSYQDIEVYKYDTGEVDLLVSVGFVKWIDNFNAEWGIILRFKQIDGKWKLYLIYKVT